MDASLYDDERKQRVKRTEDWLVSNVFGLLEKDERRQQDRHRMILGGDSGLYR
ncbi:hypothetical protein CCM_06201 [Cordyceps militaris CM01]|uniref:Uncharacterized protein n=1 Tax=Cordyceps militaris (strain CM01) TaxID=983644 RepID=G3JJ99_CORMM|nr:uncharacterized protein CCM_06201 [Cordyceps militaris CM01]EGX92041.1 hypothetical protein CCM_06201 [Cordyceps militaris CM01]